MCCWGRIGGTEQQARYEMRGVIEEWTRALQCSAVQCSGGLVCGVDVVCGDANVRARRGWGKRIQKSKEYAVRDSNPQPPDSKSDTLSIAPTAPPKRGLTQQQTTTRTLPQQRRSSRQQLSHTHIHTHTRRRHQATSPTYNVRDTAWIRPTTLPYAHAHTTALLD